jgi:hypothetical protein
MEEDIELIKLWSGYGRLTVAEQKGLLNTTKEYAERPQPFDYGISRYDLCRHDGRYPSFDDGLKYKEDKRTWLPWIIMLLVAFAAYISFCIWLQRDGSLSWGNAVRALAVFPATFMLWAIVLQIVEPFVEAYERRKPNADILRYKEALRQHWLYRVATYEAELAVLRQKRSYWEQLGGYEFERATAEVLKRHQFNPRVTRGSADGGVDIEVVRSGHKGIVQCKAHVASVGPHTVRDLYGVIHHSKAEFGMIVSRGGFTKGAADFARNKPIFLLDTSDLIAMQEGRDVLGSTFTDGKT